MSKMNHSRSHHDRHKACDAEMNEPVYENAGVSFADLQKTKCILIFRKKILFNVSVRIINVYLLNIWSF